MTVRFWLQADHFESDRKRLGRRAYDVFDSRAIASGFGRKLHAVARAAMGRC